jgi:hypothetical protein
MKLAAIAGFALAAQSALSVAGTTVAGTTMAASEEPSAVLKRYINLRLANADRSAYAALITWSQEPSWDCSWVTSTFKLQQPKPASEEVVIPVTYLRLGRYCPDFNLQLFDESDEVEYHLVMSEGAWKVAAPAGDDYPDIEIQTLLRSLTHAAQAAKQSAQRRRQYDDLIRQLRATLRAHPRIRPATSAR